MKEKSNTSGMRRFIPLALLIILLLGGLGVSIVYLLITSIKSETVYTHAVQTAKENPKVVEALGTPIEEGFLPAGKINFEKSQGTANLKIQLYGPRGEGEVWVQAKREAGDWRYKKMIFTGSEGEVALLEGDAQAK